MQYRRENLIDFKERAAVANEREKEQVTFEMTFYRSRSLAPMTVRGFPMSCLCSSRRDRPSSAWGQASHSN
jgi:hypothetical protein